MNPALIVGLAPGYRGDGVVLSGHSGKRLASLCGLSLEEYLRRFDRCNVSDGESRTLERIAAHKYSVILGRWALFTLGLEMDWFAWEDAFRDRASLIAACPHPSGRNRWWNDAPNVDRAAVFWRDLVVRAF